MMTDWPAWATYLTGVGAGTVLAGLVRVCVAYSRSYLWPWWLRWGLMISIPILVMLIGADILWWGWLGIHHPWIWLIGNDPKNHASALAALGTFLAAAVALFRDEILSLWHRPRLVYYFEPNSQFILQRTNDHPWFVRMLIHNTGTSPAEHCFVQMQSISQDAPLHQGYQLLTLCWGPVGETLREVTLASGERRYVHLFHAVRPEDVPDHPFALKVWGREAQPVLTPSANLSTVRVHIYSQSRGAAPRQSIQFSVLVGQTEDCCMVNILPADQVIRTFRRLRRRIEKLQRYRE